MKNQLEMLDSYDMNRISIVHIKSSKPEARKGYMDVPYITDVIDELLVDYKVRRIVDMVYKYGKIRVEVVSGHDRRQRIIKADGHSRYRMMLFYGFKHKFNSGWSEYHGSCYMHRKEKFKGCEVTKVVKSMFDHDLDNHEIIEIRAGFMWWKNITNE